MNVTSSARQYILVGLLLFVGHFLTVAPKAFGSEQAYVFSSSGEYVLLDTKAYASLKEGNFWDEVSRSKENKLRVRSFFRTQILDVISDQKRSRLFLLLGEGQAGRLHGYLVVRNDTLHIIHMLERAMSLEATFLVIDPAGERIYVTHWDPLGP